MTESNDNPTPVLIQQIAVEITIGDGANARIASIPVADATASLALQKRIAKHHGIMHFGEDTNAPMSIQCGRVTFMCTVLLEPTFKQPPPPPKLATLRQ